ncbi:GNAT family N-acetyltransferase [Fictibacillus aquaticus]|uniref:GNAT family N-acetyltransferase n=1 Tax=Fictibacillus aquaticus TaxID=2021314 RepID=A0A235F7Q9_9BACL|nr:GNAT family N-acetyltransferase [Fictibacillus aquaticus]OYD57346.1 GNAT family N-acetyltransferase [Fictibacillus aquaticus]
MQRIEIRRPVEEDRSELHHFFKTVITDTFNKNGIGDKAEDLENEINEKKKYLELDYKSDGRERYFLIALSGSKIVGSIEYGPASELITDCSSGALSDLVEVGTVFVHPEHQRNGLGRALLEAIYDALHKRGIHEFCLDSGYESAQIIWRKKFGEPDYWMKDYWGEGMDHMIWKVSLQ